jgi:hypothetical protein
MQRDTAVTIIKSRLGNLQGTAHDNLIVANMQLVQATTLERGSELPWFLAADSAVELTNIATVAREETANLPSNFLREDDERRYPVLRVDSTAQAGYYPLEKLDYTKAIGRYVGGDGAVQSGKPTKYDILGEKMYFRYIPDGVYTIRLFYFKSDVVLSSNVENQWLKYAPDWVLAETCRQTAEDLQYQKLIEKFTQDGMIAKDRVLRETISRREAGYMRMMGED